MAHGGAGYVAPKPPSRPAPRVPPTRAPATATSNLVRSPVPMSFARMTPQQQQLHQRIQRAFVAPFSENMRKYNWANAVAIEHAKTAQQALVTHQQRKAKIDSLVGETFTATPQRNAQIARQFKSMDLSPAEIAYVSHSSRVRGDIAMQRANPYNTLLATLGQSGINPHSFEHPIARLTDKGEFAPHGTLGY